MRLTPALSLVLLAGLATAGPVHAQGAMDRMVAPSPDRVSRLLDVPLPSGFALPRDQTLQEGEDLIEYHARGVPVHDVFEQLRDLTRRNIVVAPGVTTTFTGDMFGLNAQEAIDLICRSTGLVATDEGAFIFIGPAEASTRVFVLENARAADLLAVIKPLLSEGAEASATTVSKTGIESSQVEAGGDDYAASDVLVVSGPENLLEKVAEIVATLDRRPRQVLLEATILSAELRDSMSLGINFSVLGGVDFDAWGASSPDGTSMSGGSINGSQLEQGVIGAASGVASGLPTSGLTAGIINGDIGAFVRALQQITNTSILANPKMVTLNKQRGEVLLGRRDGYLTTIVTDTTTTQTVEFIETGTRLVYRPFIGDDGLIRLEVHPEDSEGGLNENGLPFKETAEVTTNILVRDGETVVIGGLFREKLKSSTSKVPVMGDLPFLGPLFRGNTEETIREEIIVLLTPHIIDMEGLDDVEAESVLEVDLSTPAAVRRLYFHTARALSTEGEHGCAMLLIAAAGKAFGFSADALGLRGRISRGLVPSVSTYVVDRRILKLVQGYGREIG